LAPIEPKQSVQRQRARWLRSTGSVSVSRAPTVWHQPKVRAAKPTTPTASASGTGAAESAQQPECSVNCACAVERRELQGEIAKQDAIISARQHNSSLLTARAELKKKNTQPV
jgi:hypothetical protein